MSEWWTRAYPGGPMVAVLGFPRPLYPPDSAPDYVPSADGPDVEAYKRCCWRAGRWPGPASGFDQAFSNGFSHGRAGGNVGDSGIAGVQRQGNVSPDTGFVGKQTFNLLRSIRIPAGLPHAGEPAMDARAVELINAAWNMFKGNPTPPASTGSSAKARIDKARGEVGYAETPSNSNRTKYGAWYGMDGQPWCGQFVTWCDQLGKNPSQSLRRGQTYAYVPYIVNDARMGVNGLSVTSSPQPGDLVCFDWDRDGTWDHVGVVATAPDASGVFTTVEGNTSTSNQSNGGQVMQRTRNRNSQGTLFVRVRE